MLIKIIVMSFLQKLVLLLFTTFFILAFIDKPAYMLYDKQGEATDYSQMLEAVAKADVVLFGEFHNNPISHWLQISLTEDVFATKKQNLVLGAEMFEADNQIIINEYFKGLINESKFEEECRLWPNYKTDYKPLIDFAKNNGINFIATNIPRRYASLVFNNGIAYLDSLSDDAKKYMAPLPITFDLNQPAYQQMLDMMGGHGGAATENFPKAQAVKDATMAHFILQNWEKGKTFIHYNGAFHSDNYDSIVWYLKQQKKKLNILTISTVEQQNLNNLEEDYLNLADFIITVPTNMTKTH